MAAHRYWRLKSRQNFGGQTGITRLEMASGIGGANLCTTPSQGIASGAYSGGSGNLSIEAAFTGVWNVSNWFTPQDGTVAWIGYDFGSGNAEDVDEFRVMGAWQDPAGTPRWFDIESSDDGVTWTYEWVCLMSLWPDNTMVSFPRAIVQDANEWWAIMCLDSENASNDTVIAEIEFRIGASGGDESTPTSTAGTAFAGPVNGSYPAVNAFDDDNGTIFYAGVAGRLPFIGAKLPSAKAITHAAITASPGNNTRAPKAGRGLYGQNGTSFHYSDAADWASGNYGASEQKVFEIHTGGGDPGPAPRRRQAIVC